MRDNIGKDTGCFVMYQPDLFDNSHARLQERFVKNGRLKRCVGKELVGMGISWCCRCAQFFPLEEFPRSKNESTGFGRYCFSCRRRVGRIQGQKRAACIRDDRETRKAELVNMLGGRCVRCGYREFTAGLDFHHIAPQSKRFVISTVLSTRTRNTIDYADLIKEVDKCALLCSNCHKSISFWIDGVKWSKNLIGWEISLEE